MNVEQFARCTGATLMRATLHHLEYVDAMTSYGIATPQRQVMLLANVGYECGGFRFPAELWGPTDSQRRYERDFAHAWPPTPEDDENSLAFRLGNVNKGDGYLFRGHGDLQNTGRANACKLRDRLRARFPKLNVPDFELDPDKLSEPRWAALAACDYVDMMGCNAHADAGEFDAYCDLVNRGRVTQALGDSNGYASRLILLHAGYAAMGLQ